MKTVERVGVKNLKNNLSAYLRHVKQGVRVLVTDRDEVIAEIEKPRRDVARENIHPLLAEWIAAGELKPSSVRKKRLPRSPVSLPAGTAQRLLDEDRGE